VSRILDYSTRTSDKQAYISPTRGAQGNALKTIMAIPFVLNSGQPSTVEIEARGVKHVVTVATDHIARRPAIDHQQEFVETDGTTIRLVLDCACLKEEDDEGHFLQGLVRDYALFNRHATFLLSEDDTETRYPATYPGWKKWLPTDPTSPHWYSPERFGDLIASYIGAEREGAEPRTVRAFIAEFRGLSATAKQKKVSAEAGLERAYLHDLVTGKTQLDKVAIGRLLDAMKGASKPVKPEALGVLGEPHFRALLVGKSVKTEGPETADSASLKEDAEDHFLQNRDHEDEEEEAESPEKTFRYKTLSEINEDGLPCVVEVAFCLVEPNSDLRGVHFGLNWSPPLGNPLQEDRFGVSNDDGCYGFSALLEHSRINISRDPVCLVVHLICPRFNFLDRGKGSVAL
jgi:hypothetical protein